MAIFNKQVRTDLAQMMQQFAVLKDAAGKGVLTLTAMQTAIYLFMGMTKQGLELHKVAKTLGFRQQSSADRVVYLLADDPVMVRGGRCLGWFRIEKDQQDARYRRIFITDKGMDVVKMLDSVTMGDLDYWQNVAAKDAEESKVHHHMSVEQGKFHWGDVKDAWEEYISNPKWGKSEKYSIPTSAWRSMPTETAKRLSRRQLWWVDTKTGATWKGMPTLNPYRASRTIPNIDFKEARKLTEENTWVRKRGDKGRWYMFEPNKDPAKDTPDYYVKDADADKLTAFIDEESDLVISGKKQLSEALFIGDMYLNKNDFNRFRRGLHKALDEHYKDLERKMGAEYRNQVAAEGMSRAAAKHAALVEMEMDAKGKHIHPQERARLETDRAQALKASEELEERSKPSQEYLDMQKKVESMEQMMKQLQETIKGFGQGAYGKGPYGGSGEGDGD